MKKVYVSMTDSFLSGWGESKNKTAKFVLECDGMDEATTVKDNAENRSDMNYVYICINKPSYNTRSYQVTYSTKQDAPNFYKLNHKW